MAKTRRLRLQTERMKDNPRVLGTRYERMWRLAAAGKDLSLFMEMCGINSEKEVLRELNKYKLICSWNRNRGKRLNNRSQDVRGYLDSLGFHWISEMIREAAILRHTIRQTRKPHTWIMSGCETRFYDYRESYPEQRDRDVMRVRIYDHSQINIVLLPNGVRRFLEPSRNMTPWASVGSMAATEAFPRCLMFRAWSTKQQMIRAERECASHAIGAVYAQRKAKGGDRRRRASEIRGIADWLPSDG